MKAFTDKTGRQVQVGDTLVWEAISGTIQVRVLRYDTLRSFYEEHGSASDQQIPAKMRNIVRGADGRYGRSARDGFVKHNAPRSAQSA